MLKKSLILIAIILFISQPILAQDETEPTAASQITAAKIPSGALRVLPGSVPSEINEAFEKLTAAAEGKLQAGRREVLAWTRNYRLSNAPNLIKQIQNELQTNGWIYEVGGRDGDLEVFSLSKAQPHRRVVLGFFVPGEKALVMALLEVLPFGEDVKTADAKTNYKISNSLTASGNNSSAKVFNVEKNANFVNVMGVEMPKMPQFPALSPKPERVRGYVKDINGNPLQNAAIGIRASYFAGMYSGAQGVTDAKGYYEFVVPKGSAHFYNAGYTIEWGDGLAAVSLHPADGKLDSFTTADGAVENFVLLPYGITSRENLSENPQIASIYYGGSIYIGYSAFEASDNYPPPYAVPENSVIEITLTSEGEMSGGVPAQSFVVRKIAGFQSGFKINNLPIGRYQINAKLNGKSLKMTLNSPRGTVFGMTPAETNGTADVLFAPDGAKAAMVIPNYGNWKAVEISVQRP